MKIKNPYTWALAACALVVCTYSCRKEFVDNEDLKPEVSWAKDYFTESLLPAEGNMVNSSEYSKNTMSLNRTGKTKPNLKIPIWQKAVDGKSSLYNFVEVPLRYTTKLIPAIYIHDVGDNLRRTISEDVFSASFDRLIIYKNKRGDINQRVVSFIPSEAYLKRHHGDISHNRINKLDKDFEGILIYRKWNGSFLFALIIKDGKAVKKLSFQSNDVKYLKTAYTPDQICGMYDVYEWFADCEYLPDDPVPISCGAPYSVYVGTIEICEPGPDPCLDPENVGTGECDEGDDGGDGGTDPNAPEDDGCPHSKTAAATKVNNMVSGNTSIATAVTSVLASSANLSEAIFRIDNNSGYISASTPVAGTEFESSTSINSNTIALAHDHPADGFPTPSPWDFYQAGILAVQTNGKLSTDFTFSTSASYAIVISNTTLFSQFLTNYPMSSTLEKDSDGDYTGDFKRGSGGLGDELFDAFTAAYLADPRHNGSLADKAAAEVSAMEYSTAKLMSYTMGSATLLKKDANGNWKALHYTKATVNGITTYTVTPCN